MYPTPREKNNGRTRAGEVGVNGGKKKTTPRGKMVFSLKKTSRWAHHGVIGGALGGVGGGKERG